MYVSLVHVFEAAVHWALSAAIYIYIHACIFQAFHPSLPLTTLSFCLPAGLWSCFQRCLSTPTGELSPSAWLTVRQPATPLCTPCSDTSTRRRVPTSSTGCWSVAPWTHPGPGTRTKAIAYRRRSDREPTDGTRSGGWPGNCRENIKLIHCQWRREQNWSFLLMSARI